MAFVSVIIPNFNKSDLVCQSLESLLRQTFDAWEAIVIDDCSSDESWALVKDYSAKDSRIISVRNETNRGGNYCRNLGAKLSKGEYIMFLDSDDWIADDCLEGRVGECGRECNKGVDMLVFPMISTKDGRCGKIWDCGNRKNALVSFLRHEVVWQTMMPIWRRTAFERIGGFDELFPRLQDVELHTRALLQGVKYKFAERTTPDCFYFIGETRVTANFEKAAENFVRATEMYIVKMKKLIAESQRTGDEKERLMNALIETQMAAIRNVGDSFQSGKVGEDTRDSLFSRILSINEDVLVKLYAAFYKVGLNKIKGFNFAYRRLWRCVHV